MPQYSASAAGEDRNDADQPYDLTDEQHAAEQVPLVSGASRTAVTPGAWNTPARQPDRWAVSDSNRQPARLKGGCSAG